MNAVAAPANTETVTAVRNGLKLGISLMGTWGIALAIRFVLPRYLGPELFGVINWAEAFTATCFVLGTLGIDLYIRQKVAVDPEIASTFMGGVLAVRAGITLLLTVVLWIALGTSERHGDARLLVVLFSLFQFFFLMSESLGALLHARGKVDGLSAVNIGSKFLWGAGIVGALVLGYGLWPVVAAYLVAEVIKFGLLLRLVRQHLSLRFRFDAGATRAVLWSSLPFFVNIAAYTAYGRIDVALLPFNASDVEVGWYGAAAGLSGLVMLITPLIGWVMLPMLSRAQARSEAELNEMARRCFDLILSIALPLTLAMGLGADVWVRLLFGDAFAPATLALQILSVRLALSYLAMMAALFLQITNRSWRVTVTSIVALGVCAVLNLLLVPVLRARFGAEAGGAGAGAAMAQLLTEAFVVTVFLVTVGKRIFDAQNLTRLLKNVAVCAAVIVLDRFLLPLGPARIAVDAFVYLALAIPTGALPVKEILGFVRNARAQRHAAAASVEVEPSPT